MLVHDAFTLEEQDAICVARFLRNVDMDTVMQLKPLIEEQGTLITKSLLVDLQHVDFLDSAAVGVLASLFRCVHKRGLKMVFVHAQPQAQAVLEMVGLSAYVPHYARDDEARAYLAQI